MNFNLKNKVALVTGSYRGTGKSIAAVLLQEGADVIVHGFKKEATELAAEEIGATHAVYGDLTTDEGAEKLVKQALDAAGKVDILINNYGTAGFGKWLSTDTEAWLDIFQKNTFSVARMIRFLVPQMKERHSGRIIQISTIGTTYPNKVMPHYYASKSALANMTVSLAKELAQTGITVNTVSPGLIKTEELKQYYREKAKRKNWGETWEEIEKAVVENEFPNPMGRIAEREDIANLVAFLASEQAGFINGQNIRVDGGSLGIV